MGTVGGAVGLAVAALLAYSALAKLRQPTEFAVALARYRLVPRRLLPVVARLVPAAEAAVAGWLVISAGTLPLLAAGALLLCFTAAVVSSLLRGLTHACACFGAKATPVSWSLVVRNSALIVVVLAAAGVHVALGSAPRQWGVEALLAVVLVAEVVLVAYLGRFVVATRRFDSASGRLVGA